MERAIGGEIHVATRAQLRSAKLPADLVLASTSATVAMRFTCYAELGDVC